VWAINLLNSHFPSSGVMSTAGAPSGSYNELKSKECIQFRNAFRLELVLAGHSEDYLFIPIKTPQVGGNRRGSHRQAESSQA